MAAPQVLRRNLERKTSEQQEDLWLDVDAVDNKGTSIPTVPVTVQRPVFVPTREQLDAVGNFGTARASVAPSASNPNGTDGNFSLAPNRKSQTVLQQHVDFFDRDQDGIIWPIDTFHAMRDLGFGLFFSVLAAFIIHSSFSYPTLPGWFPDFHYRIYIERLHTCKHGSDSGSYDTEGRFSPQHFEDIFSKYSTGPDKDTLSAHDIVKALQGQRLLMDSFGFFAAIFEWGTLYLLFWPDDGLIKKEDVRGLLDGSAFYTIANERRAKKQVLRKSL